MKTYGDQLTEYLSWAAQDLPGANRANNTTAYVVGPVLVNQFRRFIAKMVVSGITGTANASLYLQACNTSNGTFTNISATNQAVLINTGNAATPVAGTVECRADQLPAGSQYIQAAVLVQANSAVVGAELICADANYDPAKQYNAITTFLPVANQIVY